MKDYVEHMESIAAEAAVADQAHCQPVIIRMAERLLADFSGPQHAREMFVILSSLMALNDGATAIATLDKLGSVMANRDHIVFSTILSQERSMP